MFNKPKKQELSVMPIQESTHCASKTCSTTKSVPDQHGRTCGCSCNGCNPPLEKSNYGPKGTAASAQYQPHANQERKAANTGDVIEGIGHNKNVKSFSSKPGQLSAKQQAARELAPAKVKKLSGPVRTLSSEEIAQLKNDPTKVMKEELLDEEADGKQEIIEGKEPLKKDPKQRWASLKKALDHKKAFMDLEEEMGEDEEQPQPESDDASAMQQELQPGEDDAQGMEQELAPEEEALQGEESESPPEAVSEGEEEQPEAEEGDENSEDHQEFMDALKDEGYSDQEIAYIVHGHHAPEVDPTKQAKAQATSAMSDLDLDNASKMAELERQHAEQGMAAEREHKKRMSDLEYEQAQKKHALVDQDAAHKQRMSDVEYQQSQQNNPAAMESAHKQRMLDLEYEKAKKESEQSDGSEGDAEANKQMKMLEVEKKKLELQLRKEEIKMELEFKKREHELKLKMMEAQIKEQAKQKGEISGIKHEQKLKDAKNPPKKPLKKSEEEDDEGRD